MTANEFDLWVLDYRKQFLRPDEPFGFVQGWAPKLLTHSLEDARTAIADVAANRSDAARFPRHHLPLLLDVCQELRDRRAVLENLRRIRAESAPPPPAESWDRCLHERGVIDGKELLRRRSARASAGAVA